MSYNGIGLVTPRGSGTNGYVQRNLASLHRKQFGTLFKKPQVDVKPISARKPNREILEHERKRKIEIICLEKREELEEKNVPEIEIESEIKNLRESLADAKFDMSTSEITDGKLKTHENSLAAVKRDKRLRDAFKISSDHVHGAAFDQEDQKKRRDEARLQREKTMTIQERIDHKQTNPLDHVRREDRDRINDKHTRHRAMERRFHSQDHRKRNDRAEDRYYRDKRSIERHRSYNRNRHNRSRDRNRRSYDHYRNHSSHTRRDGSEHNDKSYDHRRRGHRSDRDEPKLDRYRSKRRRSNSEYSDKSQKSHKKWSSKYQITNKKKVKVSNKRSNSKSSDEISSNEFSA